MMRWRKTILLFGVALLIYATHFFLFQKIFFDQNLSSFLNFSYAFNLSAALVIVVLTYLTGKINKKYIAFTFMGFGMFKLILFFILAKKFGFPLQKSSFIVFAIPYFMSMWIEIDFLKRYLVVSK